MKKILVEEIHVDIHVIIWRFTEPKLQVQHCRCHRWDIGTYEPWTELLNNESANLDDNVRYVIINEYYGLQELREGTIVDGNGLGNGRRKIC